MRSLLFFVLQRQLQISLLRYTSKTRLPTQQTPRGHAVYGSQTAACSAETEVHRQPDIHTDMRYLSHLISVLRWALWFQVQAGAEVWQRRWGELLSRRPKPTECRGADSHRAEPAPPAVPRLAAFPFVWMSVKEKTFEMHWFLLYVYQIIP